MSALYIIINLLGIIILKGGPIHKPYWLSWASLPYLFILLKVFYFVYGKNDIKQ